MYVKSNVSFIRNFSVVFLLLINVIYISCKEITPKVEKEEITVEVPFEVSPIVIPDFKNCKEFRITDFGAEIGNKQLISKAIECAIEEAHKNDGGVVIIPKGKWLTGKLHFKSNVNLHLEKGAVLLFDDNPEDYLPAVHTSWEGMECFNYSPLIYAYECKNIAITGEGLVEAKMNTWENWFGRPPAHMNSLKRLYNLASYNYPVEERQMVNDTAHLRPHFIQFNRCENVLLEGITIKNSPFWTIHPYLCKDVVIRNINVYAHGHNNDGVDPEMSKNVLIENCIFDQGDDAIAIKAGRNQDAWRLNTPSKNIIIRNVKVKNGHQLVALGSELSGGIENVFIDSCKVEEGADLRHLLFIKTNERRGGIVKNIYMQNTFSCKIRNGIIGIETDVLYQWKDLVPTIERRLTSISDIYINNVHASNVEFISRISGQKELPVRNVLFTKVQADSIMLNSYINDNVQNFMVEN